MYDVECLESVDEHEINNNIKACKLYSVKAIKPEYMLFFMDMIIVRAPSSLYKSLVALLIIQLPPDCMSDVFRARTSKHFIGFL